MALFAISDLHLSLSGEKPMYVFGDAWKDHHIKLKENWEKNVNHDDTILLGGDISWAMKLEDAALDFQFIDALPGKKILLKGNHDYWWQSLAKVKKALPPSMIPIQNDYLVFENDIALCGTRGWTYPAPLWDTEHDKKVYNRELIRLELSLEAASKEKLSAIIVTLHYPPFTPSLADTGFTEIMRRYDVKICLYGHLHGPDQSRAFIGTRDGIRYHFVAADYLNFSPLPIDLRD